jgi:hypothetical protein
MRKIFAVTLILLSVFALSAVSAAANQMGIRDVYQVNFSEKFQVADTVLPQGNYEIRHVMEGSNHIMIFRQLGTKKPVEVRAKCTMISLGAKADRNEKSYVLNAANQRVLHELVFKGDLSKHVF